MIISVVFFPGHTTFIYLLMGLFRGAVISTMTRCPKQPISVNGPFSDLNGPFPRMPSWAVFPLENSLENSPLRKGPLTDPWYITERHNIHKSWRHATSCDYLWQILGRPPFAVPFWILLVQKIQGMSIALEVKGLPIQEDTQRAKPHLKRPSSLVPRVLKTLRFRNRGNAVIRNIFLGDLQ